MKLYDADGAPNSRRVRIFLAEKNIEIEKIAVDLQKGDNLKKDFKNKNPLAKVPVLELDNGKMISESVAICRYFEEMNPQPPLFGTTALEKAQVEMWQRRAEFGFLFPVGMSFQHITGHFKDRMTPNPAWGEDCKIVAYGFMKFIDQHLASNQFLVDEYFSIADITMLCTLDFARVVDIRLNEKHQNLKRWYELVSSRNSAKA